MVSNRCRFKYSVPAAFNLVSLDVDFFTCIFRFMWQRISAVRLFIEHVYPSHANPEDVQTLLKLWKVINQKRTKKS